MCIILTPDQPTPLFAGKDFFVFKLVRVRQKDQYVSLVKPHRREIQEELSGSVMTWGTEATYEIGRLTVPWCYFFAFTDKNLCCLMRTNLNANHPEKNHRALLKCLVPEGVPYVTGWDSRHGYGVDCVLAEFAVPVGLVYHTGGRRE